MRLSAKQILQFWPLEFSPELFLPSTFEFRNPGLDMDLLFIIPRILAKSLIVTLNNFSYLKNVDNIILQIVVG